MTTEPSAAEHTAEDVEALAVRLMGWVRSDDPQTIGEAYLRGKAPVLFAFKAGTGYGVSGFGIRTGRWDPFIDPCADVQVLERVREVWVGKWNGEAWHRGMLFGQALSRLNFSEYNASENGRHLGPHCEYRVGFYARAALAVLREMEEG